MPFFMFKSTDFNLHSCLVCLSDKMADSALLVRSPVNQTPGEGLISSGGGGILACKIKQKKQQQYKSSPIPWENRGLGYTEQ